MSFYFLIRTMEYMLSFTRTRASHVHSSQWSSGNMSDCGVRGPRFESHRGQLMFIVNIATIYSLGHGLCTLTAVPRSTQPSTLRGMVK